MTKIPDIGQLVNFSQILWQFTDLEQILFFPDFSLTRTNPVLSTWAYSIEFSLNQF